MSRTLTAADRSALIRLASTLPAGSAERRAILAGLSKSAARPLSPVWFGEQREALIIDGIKKLAAKYGLRNPVVSSRIDSRGNILFGVEGYGSGRGLPGIDSEGNRIDYLPAPLVKQLNEVGKETGDKRMRFVGTFNAGVDANHFAWERLLIKEGVNARELIELEQQRRSQ